MSDGAHQGVSAGRALDTILGGDPEPTADEEMTAAEMREWLLEAPRCDDPTAMADYTTAARSGAGEILRWALANPERFSNYGCGTEYDWDADPDRGSNGMKPEFIKVRGLDGVLKEEGIPLETLGLTGFQWGWAYNAARRCLELPSVQNPAIVTVEL